MNLIWRFLWVIFFSRFSSTVQLFDESTTSFRVLPTDIDVLMHMNNGRYLSLMDLARIDLIIRCQLYPRLKKKNIYPVIASEMIRFKRSLSLFQRFDITTQLLGWDDKFIYLAQCFKRENKVYALAVVKACFLQNANTVCPTVILDLIGASHTSPPLPQWVNNWEMADQQFYKQVVTQSKIVFNDSVK